MGDGTEQNPYTREDVLRLIQENGSNAAGLNLSGKVFKDEIDLSDLDLEGIILKEATLHKANLSAASLVGADLSNALLDWADLRGAHLEEAKFFGAYLDAAKLRGAYIDGTHITEKPDPHLGDADWGDYKIGEELSGDFFSAERRYRHLKMWYTNSGYYDIAGEFFFREMTAKRKALKWWPKPWNRFISKFFLSMLSGYGEKPERVIAWAASVILGLAVIYFIIGSIWEWRAWWRSLYFSAVSFTALGYGSWVDRYWISTDSDWIRGIGVFEAFIGVFTIALFLVTFTRKMTR